MRNFKFQIRLQSRLDGIFLLEELQELGSGRGVRVGQVQRQVEVVHVVHDGQAAHATSHTKCIPKTKDFHGCSISQLQ